MAALPGLSPAVQDPKELAFKQTLVQLVWLSHSFDKYLQHTALHLAPVSGPGNGQGKPTS